MIERVNSRPPAHAGLRGLRFECLGPSCNNCCTGGEHGGYLALTADDVERLGDDLARVELTRVNGQLCMVLPPGGTCQLWDQGCSIYERRPQQCRNYPRWGPLRDPERMAAESERCPGIGRGAPAPLVQIRDDRTAIFAALEGER